MKRAIFPNAKLLQPIPVPDVHANISGNANSTTLFTPNSEPTQNASTTQNTQTVVQIENTQGSNGAIFYFIGFVTILIIIFVYIKKRKRRN
jgi:hypothetical protein